MHFEGVEPKAWVYLLSIRLGLDQEMLTRIKFELDVS